MMENDYYVALSESSSSVFSKPDPIADHPPATGDEDDELELGLSLGTNKLTAGKINSNRRPLSPSSSVSSSERVSDPTDADAPANPPSQVVVGWPPVRASRMISLFNQAKDVGEVKKEEKRREEKKRVGLVKVRMDGDPIGRKVDLNAHQSYKTLAAALEIMFHLPTTGISSLSSSAHSMKGSRLLDGSAEFALTYEDKDGDWLLVGDVPWGMFLDTVKKLRIMRTSDANGLAPRFQTSTGGLLGKRSTA